MTRVLVVLAASSLLLAACGKYGRPVRSQPPRSPEVEELEATEETVDVLEEEEEESQL